MMRALVVLLLVLGCSGPREETRPAVDATPPSATCVRRTKTAAPATCNGATALCDRPFDRVTTVMTHNAMSNAEDKFAHAARVFTQQARRAA